MTEQQILAFINALRCTNAITSLQKDILDTWDALNNIQFDEKSAQKQIVSNNRKYPNILIAICSLPGVIQKPFNATTQDDMKFTLSRQLDGLIAKEMETQANDKKEN